MGEKKREEEENEKENHPAVDSLVGVLTKAHHDLSLLHLKLDKEFQQIYPNNANPMKLVGRIKNIQDELPLVQDQCRHLLAAKQDLIDKASSILVDNRNMLQRIQASLSLPIPIPLTTLSQDAAFSSFNQVIEEWTAHVNSRTGDRGDGGIPEDINDMLFASIVGST